MWQSRNSGEDVKFDQPWILPNVKIITNIKDINQSERYIISNFSWSPGEFYLVRPTESYFKLTKQVIFMVLAIFKVIT